MNLSIKTKFVIFISGMALFFVAGFIESTNNKNNISDMASVEISEENKEKNQDSPIIFNVSALPQKVKVGDILTITAEIKDKSGIEKVSAIMPFENGADEITLSLISGNNKSGKWQTEWKCHNTINIEYITTVTAINILGKSATAKVSWWDDTETCWLSGWNHRKKITLSSATASTNYQVKVILATSNFDYNKAITGGDDIRFTEASGANLDYWIEEWNASGDSTLWVEVATISTSTIYMYYGNPSASSASNGTSTFLFFDDFEGPSIDTGKWEDGTAYASVNGSILTYGPGTHSMNTITDFGTGIALRANRKMTQPGSNWLIFGLGPPAPTITNVLIILFLKAGIQQRVYDADSGESISTNWTSGSYKTTEIRRETNKISWFEEGVERSNSPHTTIANIPTIDIPIVFYPCTPNYVYADWVLIRKYASTEPSATVATVEEKRPNAPGVNPSGGGMMMF